MHCCMYRTFREDLDWFASDSSCGFLTATTDVHRIREPETKIKLVGAGWTNPQINIILK